MWNKWRPWGDAWATGLKVMKWIRVTLVMSVVAGIAFASLSGCSREPRSDGPLTFGEESSESCISNPAGRDVFVGQILLNDSQAPIRITKVWPEEASGIKPLDQVIIPIIDNTGFHTERVPSDDPQWRQHVRVGESGITTDKEIDLGVVVKRTEKAHPGRIGHIVVAYTWNDRDYTARGTMAYLIPDKCEGL